MLLLALLAVVAALPLLCSAAPIHGKRSFEAGPLISSNFPDPSYILVDGTYYAFGSNNGDIKVQIATSTDFQSWSIVDADALPATGSWSDGSNVWAPNVIQLV
jgi:beta-xylosidase